MLLPLVSCPSKLNITQSQFPYIIHSTYYIFIWFSVLKLSINIPDIIIRSTDTFPFLLVEFIYAFMYLQGVKIHYVEKGDRSKPLMLFIHGFPEFWYSWRHQLKEFSKDYW
jgi:hypothetical protein